MWSIVERHAATIIILALSLLGADVCAEPSLDRVLSELRYVETSGCTKLQVRFNARIRYVSHFPNDFGQSVRVRIEPIEDPEGVFRSRRREALGLPKGLAGVLRGVEYEGADASSPTVTVSFVDRTHYRVAQGRDFRSFIVAVAGAKADPKCAPAMDEPIASASKRAVPSRESPTPSPPKTPEVVPSNPPDVVEPPIGPPNIQAEQLLIDAKTSIAAGDYSRAIQLLTKILQMPPNQASQEAKELLGLARERNGQKAHAKAEYEEYLELYPTGAGADRVRQRLAGLLDSGAHKPELRRASDRRRSEREFEFNASYSQTYDYDQSRSTTNELVPTAASGGTSFLALQDQETTTNLNQLLSAADATATLNEDGYQLRARAAGTYMNQFIDGLENQSSVSSMFLEGSATDHSVFARIGRQSRFTDGILGRFDGVLATTQLAHWLKLNVAAGFPVESPKNVRVETERQFYAGGLGFGKSRSAWNGNVYYIRQTAHSLLDREAVGLELRYFGDHKSGFASFDYDIYFNEVNLALMSWSHTFADQTMASIALDYRRSPLLTTSNALQSQAAADLNDLQGIYTVDEIHELALDRTTKSRLVTLSLARPLGERWQTNFDATISSISGTVASGGVDATPATGYEHYYSASLIGADLFTSGDTTIFGLRYFDTATSHRYSGDISLRIPFSRDFRFNPRIRTSYRQNKTNGATQWGARPSLRMNYYIERNFQIETEFGGEWMRDEQGFVNTDVLGYFFNLSYRADF